MATTKAAQSGTAPAIDPAAGYAYFGAGNPSSKQMEHRNTNAILKLSLIHISEPTRP